MAAISRRLSSFGQASRPVPGEQLVQAGDQVLVDAREHVGEIGFRVEAGELLRFKVPRATFADARNQSAKTKAFWLKSCAFQHRISWRRNGRGLALQVLPCVQRRQRDRPAFRPEGGVGRGRCPPPI